MLAQQRHSAILDLLEQNKSLSIQDITESLDISESTARRDLTLLDEQGKLTKVFGGAVIRDWDILTVEEKVSEKEDSFRTEKQKIAAYAASLVKPGDFVYIDAGTTTGNMIPYLPADGVDYVTNGIVHARRLAAAGCRTILAGGTVKTDTEAMTGSLAYEFLQQFNFTTGFFGANGIHSKCGFTTPDSNEAMLKKLALSLTRSPYILADSHKFGKIFPVSFCKLSSAVIITDSGLPASYKNSDKIVIL